MKNCDERDALPYVSAVGARSKAYRWKVGLWLSAAAAGLSAPYLVESGVAPWWLEQLIDADTARALFVFAWLWLAIAVMAYLEGRPETPTTRRLRLWIAVAFAAAMVPLIIVSIAGAAAFLISVVLAPWLIKILPADHSFFLHWLAREPGWFYLTGAIGLAICVAVAIAFWRVRPELSDDGPGEAWLTAFSLGVMPIGLVILTVVFADAPALFLWGSEWKTAVPFLRPAVACGLMAIVALSTLPVLSQVAEWDGPRTAGAFWAAFWAYIGLTAVAIALMVAASVARPSTERDTNFPFLVGQKNPGALRAPGLVACSARADGFEVRSDRCLESKLFSAIP